MNLQGAVFRLICTDFWDDLGIQRDTAQERSYIGNEDEVVDQAIIDLLKEFVGSSVAHLSHRQLQNLLDTMPTTQTLTMETQAELPSAIAKPHAGVGLAGGDRDGSPAHEASTSKCVRISDDQDDGTTEEESDADSQVRRCHRRTNTSDFKSDPDTDTDTDTDHSDSESEPHRAVPPQPNRLPATPKSIPSSSTRPAISSCPQSLASRNSIPSASSNNTAAPRHPPNVDSILVRHPPPKDLNDTNALAIWAIQIAKEQAPTADSGPSSSKSQLPDPSATTSHVARAIAKHRSQVSASKHSRTQDTSSLLSQSTSTNPGSSRTLTPNDSDNTPATSASTASAHSKKKHRSKSKLGDFPGRPGEVASAAIPYFLATVFADGAYENLEVFRDWALDAYHRSWDLEYPGEEYEAPPKGLLVIMTRRASWLRGEVKQRIRAIVQYGYGFRNPAVSRTDIRHNRRLAKKLSANVFHCQELMPNAHFEHPEFIRAIGAGLFWDPESLGMAFRERFEVIPIPAVALILTMMQACIAEWKTGSYKIDELDTDKQQVDYERHLLSLYEYERLAGGRLARFCAAWSAAGLQFSGTALDEEPKTAQPYVLASNIRPDTPPPNLED